MPNEVRRMRWGANHRDTPSRLRSFSGSRARHCPYFSQSQRKAPTEAPHFHSPTATARCHLISRSRDSFPSRGSLWPRQKVVSPLKAKRRRRANAFPLRGRCRTDVRRMRWGANHRCNPIAAVQLQRRPRSALPLILPNRKSKTLPRPRTAAACPRLQDVTSSVGSRRQLPLKGKPLAAAESNPTAKTPNGGARKSLPLEGKVPNISEADEVGRESTRYPIAAMRLRLTKRIPVFYTLPTAPKNVPQTDGFGQSAAVRVLPFLDFMIQ